MACFGPVGGLFGATFDTPLFLAVGEGLRDGDVPYRDFELEYPPGALVPFAVAALAGSVGYAEAFEATQVACGAACVVLVAVSGAALSLRRGRLYSAAVLAAAAPWLLGPLSLVRFDLWPAALCALTLAALVTGHPKLAFGALGLAVVAKGFALALVPIAFLYVTHRHGGRTAALAAAVGGAVAAAVVLPFAVIAPDGLKYAAVWHLDRGLHVESTSGSMFAALDAAGFADVSLAFSGGAWEIVGATADRLADLHGLLTVAAIAAVTVVFARSARTPAGLVTAATASILLVLVTSKVLSPQFLLWLVPFVPLVGGAGGTMLASLYVVALLLTHALFPGSYAELTRLEDQPVAVLVARNAVLVAAAVVALLVNTPAASRATARPRRSS